MSVSISVHDMNSPGRDLRGHPVCGQFTWDDICTPILRDEKKFRILRDGKLPHFMFSEEEFRELYEELAELARLAPHTTVAERIGDIKEFMESTYGDPRWTLWQIG